MLSSFFAVLNSNVFGGFDAELFQVRSLIGIERQSASPRIGIITSAARYRPAFTQACNLPSGHVIVCDYTWWAESQNACCLH
jgi:hypothetical protein